MIVLIMLLIILILFIAMNIPNICKYGLKIWKWKI